MEEIQLTSWYGKYPMIYRVFIYIAGGDRRISEPSTVFPLIFPTSLHFTPPWLNKPGRLEFQSHQVLQQLGPGDKGSLPHLRCLKFIPIVSMYDISNLHLVDFDGECREIYLSWILWD